MCDKLSDLQRALTSYAAGFDAALLTGAQAAEALCAAVGIERIAGHLKTLAAARTAETGAWKGTGHRSAAHHLAQVAGSSVGQAADSIETARRLENLPTASAAARSGTLSAQQASMVADAATASPGAERRLVEAARASSLAELRDECARTKAAAAPDLEARRRSIHAGRFLRAYTDSEGAWNLRVRHNPEVGAEVMAAVSPIRDRLFRAARAEGRREPSEAYAADALVDLVRSVGHDDEPAPGRLPAKIIARVDLAALLRGRPLEGEVCELAGFGPVAVSAVRDLIDTNDPFLAAVVTNGEQVVGVAHLGRRPTASQQTALQWLYPTCAAEGCPATAGLEFDHRVPWADSHLTVFDLIDRLCRHHHDLKTLDGWALVPGRGKRAFVAPDDPRHPCRSAPGRPKAEAGPEVTAWPSGTPSSPRTSGRSARARGRSRDSSVAGPHPAPSSRQSPTPGRSRPPPGGRRP